VVATGLPENSSSATSLAPRLSGTCEKLDLPAAIRIFPAFGPEACAIAVFEQALEQLLLLATRLGSALTEVERRCSEQQVNDLKRIG
jgi:hypothetical protein